MVDKLSSSPLMAVICGYEKSGTTLLNEILRRHPNLDSGFECGFLLCDSPRDFPKLQPYSGFFKKYWQMSSLDLTYMCDTDNWDECYRRARERSALIQNKSTDLFDKTPKYMLHLTEVLNKVPSIPCIINVRDPRSLMLSWARWSGHTEDAEEWIKDQLESYLDRYLSYANGYTRALESHRERMLLVQFEKLCREPDRYIREIFEFVGLEFQKEYLYFSSDYFVYGNTVSKDYLCPYKECLSLELCESILEGTHRYSQWHDIE